MRLIDAENLKEAIQKNICEMSCDEPRGCSFCKVCGVCDVICEQPTVTINEHARTEGYSLIKREPMPKLIPCPQCGAGGRKIEEWTGRFGYFYICSECHYQSRPAGSVRKARENWNAER